MKYILNLVFIIGFTSLISCNQPVSKDAENRNSKRIPIISLSEAVLFVDENFKDSIETLWISESLNDNIGLNMSIISDGILKDGYMPNGFEQKDGYRIYKYKK
jgi:hypothetical protein